MIGQYRGPAFSICRATDCIKGGLLGFHDGGDRFDIHHSIHGLDAPPCRRRLNGGGASMSRDHINVVRTRFCYSL